MAQSLVALFLRGPLVRYDEAIHIKGSETARLVLNDSSGTTCALAVDDVRGENKVGAQLTLAVHAHRRPNLRYILTVRPREGMMELTLAG